MKTNYLLFFLLFVVSCNNTSTLHIPFDGEYVDDAQFDTVELMLKPCLLDTIPLVPYQCCFLDSLFIVSEQIDKVRENFFKVYSKNKLVSQFGEIGNGPNDFQLPFLNSSGKVEHNFFYSTSEGKYCKISIDSADYQVKIQNLMMPIQFVLVNGVLQYNDSAIVITQTGDYQLQRYDRKTQHIDNYNYYEVNSDIPNFNMTMQLYKSSCSSNNDFVVLAYSHLKLIDIISLSDMSLHKRLFFHNFDNNDYNVDNRGNIIYDYDNITYYFTSVIAAEDKFYVLVQDCSKKDIMSGKITNSIYVIDYDGVILKQYKPNALVTSFAIKGDEIYAIVYDLEQQEKIICKGILY